MKRGSGEFLDNTGKTVSMTFGYEIVEPTRATEEELLKTDLHLLGIIPSEQQILTLNVTMNDGSIATARTNITDLLDDVKATDNIQPVALSADIELPTAIHPSCTITNWIVTNDYYVEAK